MLFLVCVCVLPVLEAGKSFSSSEGKRVMKTGCGQFHVSPCTFGYLDNVKESHSSGCYSFSIIRTWQKSKAKRNTHSYDNRNSQSLQESFA